MQTPETEPSQMRLDKGYVRSLLGADLSDEEIVACLKKMRLGVEDGGKELTVSVPAYRVDILHPIDLVEEVAIAYGYMEFEPEIPALAGLGKPDEREQFYDEVGDILVGLGFREVMTLVLTNKQDLFERMCMDDVPCVEAVKPVSQDQGVARTWLIPSLMSVLENNRNREYPQSIFEIGSVIDGGGVDELRVAGVYAAGDSSYSTIKAKVNGLLQALGFELDDEAFDHPSFIAGRCGKNRYGFFGEVSPDALVNFGLDVPVTAFELTLS